MRPAQFPSGQYPPHPDQLRGGARRWRGSDKGPLVVVPTGLDASPSFGTPFIGFIEAVGFSASPSFGSPTIDIVEPRVMKLHRFTRNLQTVAVLPRGLQKRIIPRFGPAYVQYQQTHQQSYRVADTSLDRYELYEGIGVPPDFDATGQPVVTSPSLPFTYSPAGGGAGWGGSSWGSASWGDASGGAGTDDYRFVTRRRNAYDLLSLNTHPEQFETIGGVEELGPLTPPESVQVYDTVVGSIRVVAKYRILDDKNPADTWEVYVNTSRAPVPGSDSPDFTGAMSIFGDEVFLSEEISGVGAGDLIWVTVVALRASDSERGSTTVQHTTTADLSISESYLFGGDTYEQR